MEYEKLSGRIFRCLLCRQKSFKSWTFKSIDNAILPASRKNVKNALEHFLIQCKKVTLSLAGEVICKKCYAQLADYDCSIIKTLRKQQDLMELIETSHVQDEFSGVETDCMEHMETLSELKDENFFADVLDQEDEIDRAVHDVFEVNRKIKEESELEVLHDFKYINNYFEPTLQCPLCTFQFKSKVRLQKHIKNIHKKFKCEICEYSHRNKDYVNLHMNLHEGRDETSCLYCHKKFSSIISTIRHMEAHINDKKYQCDKCGLCFSQITILNNHKMQHEAEEKPLQCDICKQLFKTKRTFRHHKLTHLPDRPRFCCEFCNKTFTEKYTLKVHKRSHPESKTLVSNDQQLLFTPEVGSTVQIPCEDNVETYRCIICEKTFAVKDHLSRHLEKEHDIILKSLEVSSYTN